MPCAATTSMESIDRSGVPASVGCRWSEATRPQAAGEGLAFMAHRVMPGGRRKSKIRLHPCPEPRRSYNAAVLDIKLIREQPDLVRQRLATRAGGDEARIDELLALDERRRKLLAEVEALKAQRNRVSKEIGALMALRKASDAEAK